MSSSSILPLMSPSQPIKHPLYSFQCRNRFLTTSQTPKLQKCEISTCGTLTRAHQPGMDSFSLMGSQRRWEDVLQEVGRLTAMVCSSARSNFTFSLTKLVVSQSILVQHPSNLLRTHNKSFATHGHHPFDPLNLFPTSPKLPLLHPCKPCPHSPCLCGHSLIIQLDPKAPGKS
jgi:hypothetical protein